ncbi:DNA topoisomerase III [Francisella philomiragia]|uniref:DNA topoisomerase III n=1 Tax=Francisella philomiragia TaxID=28110 RepID=UPI0019038B46|nr:DNA topoisomerase 3 [Francisella philomiragia]MBK2270180.1 DNA topoisomerase 3 [Francisella philomiragia]MBK2275844.1 DNA topoisomerase 3 [Francisella philomiragia]MBK2305057.1 DNA topoisomerase 3 [Francisella philomiragia]
MRVFLAEKPSQGRDIAVVLGCNQKADGYLYNNDTIVTWGFGHLLGLAQPDAYDEKFGKFDLANLPIIPEKFKLVANPKSKAQLKTVKDCLKKANEVIIATDADREGELIARLVLDNAKYNGEIKRLWLSALDEASIKKALTNLKSNEETINLYYAGLGRQRADWLMGYNYTPAATLVYGSRQSGVYSVGRVQTPTLAMIVARDYEIENFKSKDFYGIVGNFNKLKADWVVPESAKGDDEGRCLDEKLVNEVVNKCKGKNASVILAEEKAKSEKAPLCLSLSELQKIANNKYGYDAKQVLNIAQALYEKHKATTYPRSDCGYLPNSQKPDIQTIFNNLKDTEYQPLIQEADINFESRVWNDKKVGESSHHALIPTTNVNVNTAAMSEQEYNIYDIIVRYYLAQFLGDYKYNETIIELQCEDERFKTKGIVPTEYGWKKALNEAKEKADSSELPKLSKGEILSCKALKIEKKKTTPPPRYTDATLISAMKNCGRKVDDKEIKDMLAEVQGIGTEATRADVIETLKDRAYIVKKGKNIISTDKGRALISLLPEELTSVVITAEWESKLSQVAKGNMELDCFIQGIERVIKDNLEKITGQQGAIEKVIDHPCPKCGGELIRFKRKSDNKFAWLCSNNKNEDNPCKTFMDDKAGKPVPQKPKTTLEKSGHKCVDCGSDIVKRKGKYGDFPSCMGYPKCTTKYYYQAGKPVKKDA